MSFRERLYLQLEELLRLVLGWIPGGLGTWLRRFLYAPFFASASYFRSGVGVAIQGFRNISLGKGAGLNRYSSLYAARGKIKIGEKVFLGDFSSINANDSEIEIGNQVIIGPMTIIQGANHAFDRLDISIMDQGHMKSFVKIEDNVWIGAHCTILPGVTVKSGSVIAAGAVVTRDVPTHAIVAGVPAKLVRYRGIEA